MQQLVNLPSAPHISTNSNNDTIFYNFVGNFVPPEWRDLQGNDGKTLSKTAKQLLSLLVFRLQVCHNSCNNLQENELQESYHFFEQSLSVCQRRIRQCMLELQEGGFIHLYNATIIKQHIKCRNTPCIKLAKNFRTNTKKFSGESEENFRLTRKKFQAHNIIDNNNRFNISRSSESTFLKNVIEENLQVHEQEQPQEKAKHHQEAAQQQVVVYCQEKPQENLQPEEAQAKVTTSETEELDKNAVASTIPLANSLTSVMQTISSSTVSEMVISSYPKTLTPGNNNGLLPKKRLSDFHPLTETDADLLQLKSKREFNLSFINQLLLKLAEQYPNHHFCNKKVVMNYMVKALAHELRESDKVNNGSFQFKSNDESKLKEQYLEKIERSTNTSKQAQLKRKIAGVFEQDAAYELLNSCTFGGIEQDQYQLQLFQDISVSAHTKTKILEQVQAVYGNKINQLQIIPFMQSTTAKQDGKTENDNQFDLLELDTKSVWYKVRLSLIERHGKDMDSSIFSKLAVVSEDSIAKKVILKSSTAFIDYWVRQRYMRALESAFQAQNFTFELVKGDGNG